MVLSAAEMHPLRTKSAYFAPVGALFIIPQSLLKFMNLYKLWETVESGVGSPWSHRVGRGFSKQNNNWWAILNTSGPPMATGDGPPCHSKASGANLFVLGASPNVLKMLT